MGVCPDGAFTNHSRPGWLAQVVRGCHSRGAAKDL